MLTNGVLNPAINSLMSRVRHTNMLVIADRGFPYWTMIETVDISLIDDVPTVLQVFNAIRPSFSIGEIYMAEQFNQVNTESIKSAFLQAMKDIPIHFEEHEDMKLRVPHAIGLIRTGDTTQYANMVLVSA